MRLTTLHKVVAHDEGAWSCAWVPGSNRLLTASVDESVKVWEDTPEGLKFQHTYQGHSLGVVSVATSSNGQYAASSALDSYVRVWSLADHSTAAMIEVGSRGVPCMSIFVPCGIEGYSDDELLAPHMSRLPPRRPGPWPSARCRPRGSCYWQSPEARVAPLSCGASAARRRLRRSKRRWPCPQ